jgi:hypothetical protein
MSVSPEKTSSLVNFCVRCSNSKRSRLILLVEVVIMGIHFSYGMMEFPQAVYQKQGT